MTGVVVAEVPLTMADNTMDLVYDKISSCYLAHQFAHLFHGSSGALSRIKSSTVSWLGLPIRVHPLRTAAIHAGLQLDNSVACAPLKLNPDSYPRRIAAIAKHHPRSAIATRFPGVGCLHGKRAF